MGQKIHVIIITFLFVLVQSTSFAYDNEKAHPLASTLKRDTLTKKQDQTN